MILRRGTDAEGATTISESHVEPAVLPPLDGSIVPQAVDVSSLFVRSLTRSNSQSSIGESTVVPSNPVIV